MNLRIRARLNRLEKDASALRDAEESGPTMQQLLLAIDGSPQAGQFCELARRSVFPDTPPDQAHRIRQTLDDWTLEIITRLADGQTIAAFRFQPEPGPGMVAGCPGCTCRPGGSGFAGQCVA